MRFLTRSLAGVFLFSLTLGLLAMALGNVFRAQDEADAADSRGRPAQERIFAVPVATVQTGEAVPVITAYGEVSSRRSLELRAAVAGRIIEINEAFLDGGEVAEGEVILQIDPADAQSTLDVAVAELAEARAQAVQAAETLALAADDLAAAERTAELRALAVTRQADLRQRGAGTGAAVEDAEIAEASARQTVVGRRQALSEAGAQAELTQIAVNRAEIAVREAERTLADTTVTAPFDGRLTETVAVRGGIVGVNERLGTLLDTGSLEIAFQVSTAQYARLFADGKGVGLSVEAVLPLEGFPVVVNGVVDRVGGQVGEGLTGRLVYARLDGSEAQVLRPGDFMSVRLVEPALQNVSVVPAAAVGAESDILLLAEDDRLQAQPVTIQRRQGNEVIIAGAPAGREYVTERLPQLGTGVKTRPIRAGDQPQAREMVTLDPERRARLIAAVEANTRMPAQARNRVLAVLEKEQVPAETVQRIEARMGGGAPPLAGAAVSVPAAGNTVALAPDRRAKLIAFVRSNDRMPVDVKERLLSQLAGEEVPSSVVERLESRIGG
ncbi:MAG: HlyD family efflux transporter periplasmic adaptor subunit [Pseudomonadota bacterium]